MIDITIELIPVPCTNRDAILRLRSLLIDIQAQWLDTLYDSAMTFSDPETWEKMQEAVCLLTRRDNPSAKGIDLNEIASDYKLLEQIFLCKRFEITEEGDRVQINAVSLMACDLVKMHGFSPIRILEAAQMQVLQAQIQLEETTDDLDAAIKEVVSKGFEITEP